MGYRQDILLTYAPEISHNYKRYPSSSSEINEFTFVFEDLQTTKTQLQTISKFDFGVKYLHDGF